MDHSAFDSLHNRGLLRITPETASQPTRLHCYAISDKGRRVLAEREGSSA